MLTLKPKIIKQAGMTLIELAIVMALGAVIIIAGMRIVPSIQFSLNASELTQEVNEIRTAVVKWKAARPSFAGVTTTTLCTGGRQLLTASTCGAANDGVGAVPFGGDYVVAPAADPSRFTIDVTGLPTARVTELADSLAPFTRDRCTSGDACATAVVTPGGGQDGSILLTF